MTKIKIIFYLIITALIFSVLFFVSACVSKEIAFEDLPPIEPEPDWAFRRISVAGNEFVVNEKRIWINGVNTPWNAWDEFGSTWYSGLNTGWWDDEFARLKNAGVNATRVWISCKSAVNQVTITNNGTVTGVTARFWADVDKLFALAAKHKIYIMATLVSFDHFNNEENSNVANFAPRWRAMLNSDAAVASFVNNYTIPFVNRYKVNPYLWSIDICNEPDWIHERQGVSWERISYWLAANAAAIHENSDVLVTVGIAYAKWNTGNNNPVNNNHAQEGNKVSDQYLKGLYNNNPNAYLDFFSPHYYSWNAPYYGVAHYLKPWDGSRARAGNTFYGGYGFIFDDNNPEKPAVLGECPAVGTNDDDDRRFIRELERPPVNNTINDYEYAFNNGWQGILTWTSNGVDGAGSLNNSQNALLNMESKYTELIYPDGKE